MNLFTGMLLPVEYIAINHPEESICGAQRAGVSSFLCWYRYDDHQVNKTLVAQRSGKMQLKQRQCTIISDRWTIGIFYIHFQLHRFCFGQ
jgi:hypothetical protein